MRQRAFTLIEVTVAVALFGICMVFLLSAFTNTLVSLSTLQRDSDYTPYLRWVRAHAISTPVLDDFERGDDIQTPDGGRARWEAEAEPMEVADLFRVTLRIELSLPDSRDTYEHEEVLYLMRPTWSDPIDRSTRIADATDELERVRREASWR